MSADTEREDSTDSVDARLSISKLGIYGFQHVLAFFAGGAIIIPIIVASAIGLTDDELVHLINAALLTCGVATLLQAVGIWKIGVRLPLLQGIAFAGVAPMIAIAMEAGGGADGLRTVYGAIIVCGIATFALAPLFGKMARYFPPVVTGTVLTIIGLALLPEAANSAVGGSGEDMDPSSTKNLLYALGTLAFIVLARRLFKGFLATVAVLLAMVLGTVVAALIGDTDFQSVGDAAAIGIAVPFQFGAPIFSPSAIVTMMLVIVITAIETTGAVFAVSGIVDRRPQPEDITRAMRADGLSVVFGGVFNSFPYTCFAENVGLVRLTGVKSRWVIAAAGVIMILLGMFPKLAALVLAIPAPVLGGASLAMFAMVAVVGIEILSGVDFKDQRNAMIVAGSLGIAMYVTAQPDVVDAVPAWMANLLGSGITIGALTAILLNLLFHHWAGRRDSTPSA